MIGERVIRGLILGLAVTLIAVTARAAEDPFAIGKAPADDRQQVLVLLKMPAEHYRPNADYAGGYGAGAGQTARRRIAQQVASHHGLTLVTSWPMPLLGLDCFVMAVPDGRSPDEAAAQLAHDPQVESSEPMHLYGARGQTAGAAEPAKASPAPSPAADHNDPLFHMQPAASQWRLAELHQSATGRGVRVAVIDSKVDAGHPDLAGQIQLSQDFAPDHPAAGEQHGTGVAGVIAGIADNHLGIAGVAPRARILALRACWRGTGDATVCDTLSLAKALHYAVDHDAKVINLSLSGPSDALLGKLVDVALARGTVVVAAYDPALARGGFPASHAGVVAATDDPALAGEAYLAPGRDVPTTQPGGRWFLVNGSSYSAAHVSGLFALLRERSGRPTSGLSLVSAHPGGGGIDACATLSRGGGSVCGPGSPPANPAIARQ